MKPIFEYDFHCNFLSEKYEYLHKHNPNFSHRYIANKLKKKSCAVFCHIINGRINISDEIADVFIYLISLVNLLNLDLSQAFISKMDKNKKKYDINEFNNGLYYKK